MKKTWPIRIKLDKSSEKPIYQQLVAGMILEIQRGRLTAGMKLPGTRTLAEEFGVNRNTVVEAFQELIAQGWIESSQGKNAFVSHNIGSLTKSSPIRKSPLKKELQLKSKYLKLSDGSPDSRLFPIEVFSRTYGRVARKSGRDLFVNALNTQGSLHLRKSLSEMLRMNRGLSCTEDDLIITRGSQQAIFLVSMALRKISKEDLIVVESPGYIPGYSTFEETGFKTLEIEVDEEGLNVDLLEKKLLKGIKIAAVYTTPHHQYPTTVTMKADRRMKLIELSQKYNFWIIEDDYDHDFHYETQPVFPLASYENASKVIYLCSLSKILSTGLRIGYLFTPPELAPAIIEVKSLIDKIGDPILEKTIAEMIDDGELQRHINKMRNIYRERRDKLFEAFSLLSPLLKKPQGGMSLWIPLPHGMSYDTFTKKLAEINILPVNKSQFFSTRTKEKDILYTRIGFASLNETEIQSLAKLLKSKKT